MLVWLALCAAEVTLRCLDGEGELDGTPAIVSAADLDPLLAASWVTHHGLQPLTRIPVPHPDTGRPVEVRINSFGLRGVEPELPKPPTVFRILCLGDETVLAPDVEEEGTFCRLVEQQLQSCSNLRIEVLNAGVPHYCPLLSLLQYRHSLSALAPDVVVLHFDMSDVADDRRFRPLTVVADDGMPLACAHPRASAQRRPRSAGPEDRFYLVRWCQLKLGVCSTGQRHPADLSDIEAPEAAYAWLRDDPPDWQLYIRQSLLPVVQLHRMTQHSPAVLILAAIPAPWQVSAAAGSPELRRRAGVPADALYRSRWPFEWLTAVSRHAGIAFLDPSPVFQSAPRPERLYLQEAPRLSADGHALYAQLLAGFLQQQVAGPWNRPESLRGVSAPTRQAVHESLPPQGTRPARE